MENNQNNVLRAMYWKGKEMTITEIMKDTSLKREQVYRSVQRLVSRGFIGKETEQPGWTDGKWHPPKSKVKIKNMKFAEQYLINKELI